MARVRSIASAEPPPHPAAVRERVAGGYGPFRNQGAMITDVPVAMHHPMPMEPQAAGSEARILRITQRGFFARFNDALRTELQPETPAA